MWVGIAIIIIYAFFVFALFVDDPDFKWDTREFRRIGAKFTKGLRNLFNKEDDKLD